MPDYNTSMQIVNGSGSESPPPMQDIGIGNENDVGLNDNFSAKMNIMQQGIKGTLAVPPSVDSSPPIENVGSIKDIENSAASGMAKSASYLMNPIGLAKDTGNYFLGNALTGAGGLYEAAGGELPLGVAQWMKYPLGDPAEDPMSIAQNQILSAAVKEATGMDMNYQPQTGLGQALHSAISSGPFVAGSPSSLLRAAGIGGGGEAFKEFANKLGFGERGQEVAQLIGGGIGGASPEIKSAAGNLASKALPVPTALPSDVADVIKASDAAGVQAPNAALTNANTWAANHTNMKGFADYKAAVNKNAADLIGANDGDTAHITVNEKALNDAIKNNGKAIETVDSSIGNVPLGQRIKNIISHIGDGLPSDQSFWNRFSNDVSSKLNSDGTIHASDVRDLTGYKSDLAKKARGPTNDASTAQKVLSELKGAVTDAATPEQQAALFDVNNKYKLMTAFKETGKTLGAGGRLEPKEIQGVINNAYTDPNEVQYPARNLQDTLNTLHPVKGTESPLLGLGNIGKLGHNGNGVSALQEIAIGIAGGHALPAIAFAALHKLAKTVPDWATSLYTNSPYYRAQLLRNASRPMPPASLSEAPPTPPAQLALPAPSFKVDPMGNVEMKDIVNEGVRDNEAIRKLGY